MKIELIIVMNILSSMGPISNNSTIDAIPPAIAPPMAIPLSDPKKKPIGIHTNAMKRFPIGCLVLFLNTAFRIIPVTPSPKDMNNAGIIAIHL